MNCFIFVNDTKIKAMLHLPEKQLYFASAQQLHFYISYILCSKCACLLFVKQYKNV